MKKADKIFKDLLNENLGYIDLKPINQIEASPKTDFENKFAEYLAEDKKKDDEDVKVEEKKVSKHVEEVESHNYDYKDPKNLNNQIGQEVLNGIYFEAKQNPDKTLEEIREIVSKNLAKDGQYYIKNAAFGIEGLGYTEQKTEEVSGKYAASGYSDKIKEVVKESLGAVLTSGNPNSFASMSGEIIKQMMNEKEEEVEESYDEFQRDDKGAKGIDKKDKGEEDAYGAGVAKGEKIEKKKLKKETLDTELAEIDKQAQIVALEAKLDKMDEVIENKQSRINMVSEDENLAELMDKKKLKSMQKEVKILEKRKAKMEKMYEKMCGKKYQREEIVDEVEEIYESKDNSSKDFIFENVLSKIADLVKGKSPSEKEVIEALAKVGATVGKPFYFLSFGGGAGENGENKYWVRDFATPEEKEKLKVPVPKGFTGDIRKDGFKAGTILSVEEKEDGKITVKSKTQSYNFKTGKFDGGEMFERDLSVQSIKDEVAEIEKDPQDKFYPGYDMVPYKGSAWDNDNFSLGNQPK